MFPAYVNTSVDRSHIFSYWVYMYTYIQLAWYIIVITVIREYFDVKIFSDSMACAKIKRTKYMRNINDYAVQGRLSENYLTRKIIA